MKNFSSVVGKLIFLLLLLLGAFVLVDFMDKLGVPWGLDLFLLFVLLKMFTDIVQSLISMKKKFLYFEDYLREMGIFILVSVVGTIGVMAVEYFIGGVVWYPVLAAGLIWVWRK